MNNIDITNKSAIVTGASRGIGRETAICLAKDGYNLTISCKNNKSKLEETAEIIKKEFPNVTCYTYVGDMGSSSCVKELFKQHSDKFNGLDLLINNAGISRIGLFQDVSDEEFDEVLHSNFYSVFYTSREAAKIMIGKKSGKIINVSSIWGERGASCESIYSASKGAVNMFTKSIAKELAPSNIAVNAVSFGMIDTEMNSAFDEDELNAIKEDIPTGSIASPRDAAKFISLIAKSDNYLTGQIITYDGGWMS